MAKQEKKIGNMTMTVNTLSPRRAYRAALNVAACFGPLLASVVEAAGAGGLQSLADGAKDADMERVLARGLRAAGDIPADKLDALVEDMIDVTTIEGPGGGPLRARFDEVFDDNLIDQFAWLAFAVSVNFGTFFRKAASAAADKAKPKAKSAGDSTAPDGSVAGVAPRAGEDGDFA